MKNYRREAAIEQIRKNIAAYGFHTYVVTGGGDPHYAYTIGLKQSLGADLVLAGAYFYQLDEVSEIIKELVEKLSSLSEWETRLFPLGVRGAFSLRKVHTSWSTKLMLGTLDFYQVKEIQAFQIVPDKEHMTCDVPDLSKPRNPKSEPAWRWLSEKWPYPIPANSVAITNLDALRGERITEVMRWEEDEWEIFAGAGPDIPDDERRVVPLGVLLGADGSLIPAVNLPIEAGFWRDQTSDWHPWGKSSETSPTSPTT